MTIRNNILALVMGAGCAAFVAGCSAEQSDNTLEQAETIEIPSGQDEANSQGTNAAEGDVTPQAVAPACIERAMLATRSLYLHSNCRTRQWVQVIINTGPDSSCFAIDPNTTATVNWAWPGTFAGLNSC